MSEHSKLKIVLVGPVYPFASGISHYTGLLCKNLRETCDVTMVSFSFQYPKLLYKKNQRDYSNDSFRIEGTRYWINTINPFNWIGSAKKIRSLNPDLVIFQWWHPYFSFCYQTMLHLLKHTKVFFICHNVFPHERFPFDKILTRHTLRLSDGCIVQSGMDEADLKGILPNMPCRKTVHPTYDAFNMKNLSKGEARKDLSIGTEEKVLLFFGFVRKYKGLSYLIDAMPMIKEQLPDCRLLIVGDFGDDRQEYFDRIKALHLEDAVRVQDGYIPDCEVEKYFSAADIVVAPYVSATQSGSIQIAYGFYKPVIATNVGGLPDVVRDRETGYLVKAQDPKALAAAVLDFYRNEREEKMKAAVKAASDLFSWDRMKETILSLDDETTPS